VSYGSCEIGGTGKQQRRNRTDAEAGETETEQVEHEHRINEHRRHSPTVIGKRLVAG
jgi:hypothetical protein